MGRIFVTGDVHGDIEIEYIEFSNSKRSDEG